MTNSAFSLIRRILLKARNYWPHIIGLFLLNLLATPIALIKPLAIKVLIDNGFGTEPVPGFISMFFPANYQFSFETIIICAVLLVIVIALIDNLYGLILWICGTYTGEKLVLEFRTLLFNHIQRISLAYHDTKGTSDSLYRIQWDAVAIRSFLLGNLSPLISSCITLLGMIVVMFTINWHFAVIALCVIPPLFILTRTSSSRLRRDWKTVKDAESSAMSVVHEVLNALRVVKAFGQEENEGERFVNRSGKAVKGQLKLAWVGARFHFMVGMIFATGTALFIYFGAGFVRSGQMTLGELTLVIAYLGQIFGPLQSISKNINDVQSSLASIERVFTTMDQEKDVKEDAHASSLQKVKGNFEFQDISFSYENKPALHNISFTIKPGDRVGIMGSTGAGKSTLISLLTRFYDPESGKILVDGTDIRKYKVSDYRNQFGIVLQEPVLFSTTIGENISYGKPGATEKEIIEAAKAANAHEFIRKLKDGYDTKVGERGMQLSGGERQRVSLARAFIKNAPVLILDEPTSSLDMRTEEQIMDAMERLMKGRTSFLITHRFDTLSKCNLILHIENGKLIDVVENKDALTLERKKAAFLAGVE
jgi:ATP-binding cassette subfamily B protein